MRKRSCFYLNGKKIRQLGISQGTKTTTLSQYSAFESDATSNKLKITVNFIYTSLENHLSSYNFFLYF
ncbi:hypothetical protein BpHYR1_006279 [Brachionus plicatilis]|uniref:Uncharacterized protein n=1 Tax=Brachionus plicatilis TaxID=10195 RepID=A0A3M7RBF8_BRAPC|nr:hypothetical protein BpHYR1_006279 [Brachionus plicatilis]